MTGNIILESTRRESQRHVKGASIDKNPTLHSHDTATHLPLRKLQESPAATNLSNRHRPDRPPTQMALSTSGPSPSLELPSPALTPLPHFLSVLPSLLDPWHFSPTLATDREGKNKTDFLYFVREVPKLHIPVPITTTSNSEGRLSAILTGNVSCD